jgi:hypothetical protein
VECVGAIQLQTTQQLLMEKIAYTHGVPGLIHLFGIESPELKSSIAIVDHILWTKKAFPVAFCVALSAPNVPPVASAGACFSFGF